MCIFNYTASRRNKTRSAKVQLSKRYTTNTRDHTILLAIADSEGTVTETIGVRYSAPGMSPR
jgi:hypothetical protein